MANSGTTMISNRGEAPEGSVWEELQGLCIVVGFSVGKMHWHLEGIISSCNGYVVTLLPLGIAVASDMTGVSVTPTIGTVGWR